MKNNLKKHIKEGFRLVPSEKYEFDGKELKLVPNEKREYYGNGNSYEVSQLNIGNESYIWWDDVCYPFFIEEDYSVYEEERGTTHEDYDNYDWMIVGRVWDEIEDDTLCENPIIITFATYYDQNKKYVDKAINELCKMHNYDKSKVYFNCYDTDKIFKQEPVKLIPEKQLSTSRYKKFGTLLPAQYHFYRYPYEESIKRIIHDELLNEIKRK